MKKRIISISIIALLTLSNLLMQPCQAQVQTAKKLIEAEEPELPFFQGIYLSADIFGMLNKMLGSDITSAEVSAEVNLKNKYFPIVEIGYGKMDAVGDETDIHYKTSAPYFRVGMSYNVLHNKPHLPGQLLVGLRYGFSSFSYDISAPDMVDPNWGHTVVPFSYQGVKTNVGWLELTAGLKAEVYKGFFMGFTARYRARLSIKKHENTEPLYTPGFGGSGSTNFGLTYNLIYKLPF